MTDEYREVLKDKYGKDVLKKQYEDREGNTKNAEELSEEDLRYLLENIQYGILEDSSYIPLRISTPEFFRNVVYEHSEGKYNVMPVPLASEVEHLRQNMDEDDGTSYGEKRPHNLTPDDIVTISKEMGHPTYIVLQKNGRYAMVVSFYNGDNKKIVVSIDFASDKEPKKNYKYQQYMNGYNEGYYNIVVTQYSPDDFLKYLEGCEIVYDKKKMNGRYQVGSGRVVTFTHDTPFIDNSIPQSSKIVKRQNSDRYEATELAEEEYRKNCKELVQMKPVVKLIGTELDGDLPLKEKIATLFNSWGNAISTERFGNVALTKSSIRSEFRHGTTWEKVISYVAIPSVIKNGVVIDIYKKNHGEVERVVAAPITIYNKPYFMGVMIQRAVNTNRFCLHDVVIKKEASEYQAQHLNTTGAIDTENLLMTEVLEKAISVKYMIPRFFRKSQEAKFRQRLRGQHLDR